MAPEQVCACTEGYQNDTSSVPHGISHTRWRGPRLNRLFPEVLKDQMLLWRVLWRFPSCPGQVWINWLNSGELYNHVTAGVQTARNRTTEHASESHIPAHRLSLSRDISDGRSPGYSSNNFREYHYIYIYKEMFVCWDSCWVCFRRLTHVALLLNLH